jgi:hypothetical protein
MRDLLKDEKKHLKAHEVIHLDIPNYSEISVKNLYEDAMQDKILKKYLPSKRQAFNKLPERPFFFGILSTLRRQYMTDIIADAHKKRFKPEDGGEKKQEILITDHWLEELKKHPYFSRKQPWFNICREAWHWTIFDEGRG